MAIGVMTTGFYNRDGSSGNRFSSEFVVIAAWCSYLFGEFSGVIL